MKKTWIFCLFCLWVGLQASYAQEKQPTLWKSPEGKYFATFYKKELSATAETDAQGKATFYLLTNDLPASVQVQVRNSCLQKTLLMTTKKEEAYSKYVEPKSDSFSKFVEDFLDRSEYSCQRYLEDSITNAIQALYPKITPKELYEKTYPVLDSVSQKRRKIYFEIKCYVPIDSLLKGIDIKTNQEKLRSFKYLFDFMRKLGLQEAVEYGKQAIELAKLTQNTEIEAELWLALATLRNESVGRFFKLEPKYTSSNPNKVLKFGAIHLDYKSYDEIIQAIAKETNFSSADIKRWNYLWGYANEFQLFYRDYTVKLYDDVTLLSDKELLEYLKIRIAQKDTNKIVWAYNALGDLYQLKYGYEEAEKYYLEMLKIRTQQQDKQKIYWVWGYLGYFYLKQEKFDLSIAYFTKLLEARKQEKNVDQIIWALGGLRFAKLTQGLPEEALAYQKQIFELYADLKQHPDKYYGDDPKDYRYLVLSVVITDYLRAFPNKYKAISDYLIKWRVGKPDGKENKIIANKIIEIATETGDLDSAIDVIKEIIKSEKDTLAKIDYMNDVAFMYQKQGKFKESYDFYQKASKEAKESKDRFLVAVQHKKLGFFYRAQNKDKEAQKEYNKLLEILKKMEKPSETDNKRDRRYRHYTFIQSLVDVCQYLQTFPAKKGQAKAIAKEAVRISDDEYTFRDFLKSE